MFHSRPRPLPRLSPRRRRRSISRSTLLPHSAVVVTVAVGLAEAEVVTVVDAAVVETVADVDAVATVHPAAATAGATATRTAVDAVALLPTSTSTTNRPSLRLPKAAMEAVAAALLSSAPHHHQQAANRKQTNPPRCPVLFNFIHQKRSQRSRFAMHLCCRSYYVVGRRPSCLVFCHCLLAPPSLPSLCCPRV